MKFISAALVQDTKLQDIVRTFPKGLSIPLMELDSWSELSREEGMGRLVSADRHQLTRSAVETAATGGSANLYFEGDTITVIHMFFHVLSRLLDGKKCKINCTLKFLG